MERKLFVMALISLAVIAGCDRKPKTEPLPQPPQIIQDQKQVLDNAKAVSEGLEKQSDAQKKQIEESTK